MNGYCAVSFALLGSFSATLFMNQGHMTRFEESLDEGQRVVYKEIKEERLRIYIYATVLAIVVGFATAVSKSNCFSVASAMTTQTLVYLLWPKSKYMMEHVKTPEQSALWIQKYKHMALLGNIGLVAGLMVYFVTSFR